MTRFCCQSMMSDGLNVLTERSINWSTADMEEERPGGKEEETVELSLRYE